MDFRQYQILFFCLCGVGLPQLAHAGAWPAKPACGQIISTTLIVRADKGFDEDRALTQTVSYAKEENSVFWEHGITDKLTLSVSTRLQAVDIHSSAQDDDYKGIGLSEFSLRHVVVQKKNTVYAVQGALLLKNKGEIIADADFGLGENQYDFRALVGHSFKWRKNYGFLEAQSGVRFRGTGGESEYHLDLAAGYRPHQHVQVIAQSFYVKGRAANGVEARKTERLKGQMSLVYDRNHKTSYQIGVYKTLLGRNIIQEKAVFVGVWQRY